MNNKMVDVLIAALCALMGALLAYTSDTDANMSAVRTLLVCVLVLVGVVYVYMRAKQSDAYRGRAHHSDHGHSVYCYMPLAKEEVQASPMVRMYDQDMDR